MRKKLSLTANTKSVYTLHSAHAVGKINENPKSVYVYVERKRKGKIMKFSNYARELMVLCHALCWQY